MAIRKKTVWGGRAAAPFVCTLAITVVAASPVRAQARLSESLQASAAEVESLGSQVDHSSHDVEVISFMAVINAAIGADQVWAGVGGLPGFTGAGVGIALIDSGATPIARGPARPR